MAESNKQYKDTDRAIALLNRKAIKRFDKVQRELQALKWDELNVLKKCKSLYEQLSADNLKTYAELADIVYRSTKPHGDEDDLFEYLFMYWNMHKFEQIQSKWPKKRGYEPELWEAWILGEVLTVPDDVTHYVYVNEVPRKAERTSEAINSTGKKINELQNGLRLWSKQTKQYADNITTDVVIKAFKDAGVKKVKWNTILDGRECQVCHDRNGNIYPINKVPPKAHYGDRCWLTPVK